MGQEISKHPLTFVSQGKDLCIIADTAYRLHFARPNLIVKNAIVWNRPLIPHDTIDAHLHVGAPIIGKNQRHS